MVTFEAAARMRLEAEELGLWETYIEQYVGCFEASMRMEWFGVAIDLARRAEIQASCEAELVTQGTQLQDMLGKRVVTRGSKPQANVLNLASSKQMQDFLYKQRGYKPKLHRKTGKITTDKDTLQALAIKHDDPALKLIIQMKKTQDFINDILNAPLDANSRIHCHHKLGGTNGTRWSTTESILGSGTNLQNIPRSGPARGLFLPI